MIIGSGKGSTDEGGVRSECTSPENHDMALTPGRTNVFGLARRAKGGEGGRQGSVESRCAATASCQVLRCGAECWTDTKRARLPRPRSGEAERALEGLGATDALAPTAEASSADTEAGDRMFVELRNTDAVAASESASTPPSAAGESRFVERRCCDADAVATSASASTAISAAGDCPSLKLCGVDGPAEAARISMVARSGS